MSLLMRIAAVIGRIGHKGEVENVTLDIDLQFAIDLSMANKSTANLLTAVGMIT
jgi:hypothetical protein